MQKLVHVARTFDEEAFFSEMPRGVLQADSVYRISTNKTERGTHSDRDGGFFLVHPTDVDNFVKYIAGKNPGVEVKVYSLDSIGICPAGDFVNKKVDKNGVLPF